ncbi:MAG: type II toxin-antitoxin system RelE/ParE family toxin [Actinomycetota bacterium]
MVRHVGGRSGGCARRTVELLRDLGPALGQPTVDRVAGSAVHNLKELRVGSAGELRVLFAFDRERRAVSLVGGDKTGAWERWYREPIPLAERLFEEHTGRLR